MNGYELVPVALNYRSLQDRCQWKCFEIVSGGEFQGEDQRLVEAQNGCGKLGWMQPVNNVLKAEPDDPVSIQFMTELQEAHPHLVRRN